MAAIAPIIVPATRSVPHTATIVFLHGLGDTGAGWKQVAQMLSQQVPHIKWVLPTAPTMRVTMARGFAMPSWFDIASLSKDDAEDVPGVRAAAQTVETLVDAEIAAGIPEDRIVVGGFSQGGATALYNSLTTKHKLAGTIALSTWLPARTSITSILDAAKKGRYFFAHGDEDQVVSYTFGRSSCDLLNKLGVPAELDAEGRGTVFNSYDGMGHEADPRELSDLLAWIIKTVPPTTTTSS